MCVQKQHLLFRDFYRTRCLSGNLETGFISMTHFKDVKKFWHLATIVELDNHSILSVYRRTTQEDLQILN